MASPLALDFAAELASRSRQNLAQSSLADLDSVVLEACLTSTAVHFRYTLEEWEDLPFFVEISTLSQGGKGGNEGGDGGEEGEGWEIEEEILGEIGVENEGNKGVFVREIENLKGLVEEGIGAIVGAIGRGSEPLIGEYFGSGLTRSGFGVEFQVGPFSWEFRITFGCYLLGISGVFFLVLSIFYSSPGFSRG